ncbi:MAG: hypothetical protein AAF577_15885 [Pseudomonadota bacterium]
MQAFLTAIADWVPIIAVLTMLLTAAGVVIAYKQLVRAKSAPPSSEDGTRSVKPAVSADRGGVAIGGSANNAVVETNATDIGAPREH